MDRASVLTQLREHRPEIAAFGVARIAIFGSVSRETAGPESDIDVLVELNRPVGLFTLAALQSYLESLLGRQVDVVTVDGLKPRIRERVLAEAIYAA